LGLRITQTYIIRISSASSRLKAEGCFASALENGLTPQYLEGVEQMSCDDVFAKFGYQRAETHYGFAAECCSYGSNILAWQKIANSDSAALILEDDTVVLGDITHLEIEDYGIYTFGYRTKDRDTYTPPGTAKGFENIPRLLGIHAYAITPKTAQWLLDHIEQNGAIYPLDRWLMRHEIHEHRGVYNTLPLFMCDPPQIVAWVRDSSIVTDGQGKYKNVPDSIIPSWLEGLK